MGKKQRVIQYPIEEFNLTERLIQLGRSDEETANAWFNENAKIVLIKHGKEGSTAYTKDGEKFSIKPFPVEALKGFGGGDGYASAFLYGIFSGWDMIDCLEFGSAEASMMVKSHSCSEELPTTEEVRKFIEEEKKEYGDDIVR